MKKIMIFITIFLTMANVRAATEFDAGHSSELNPYALMNASGFQINYAVGKKNLLTDHFRFTVKYSSINNNGN